jgi:hypothetical protein
MLVYGDIKIIQYGFLIDAKYVVGPLPIDLPNNIIFFSNIPKH